MAPDHWWSWDWWERYLLWSCVLFHAGTALALAALPLAQLLNAGTLPVFQMADKHVWAVVFGVAAVLCYQLLHTCSSGLQMVAWAVVMIPGGLWATSMGLAVARGVGSPILLIFALTVYSGWAALAIRLGLRLGKR